MQKNASALGNVLGNIFWKYRPTFLVCVFGYWAGGGGLKSLRFAVFALGNTQYEHFCYMGKWAHRRLKELGIS